MKTIDEYLEQARARLNRVTVEDLESEMASGALVVDIRPIDQRERDGDLPGAMIIGRNVLEWRLAQSSEAREVALTKGRRVILVCDAGYQSSLAAASLQELGIENATDLVGGYQAYRTA